MRTTCWPTASTTCSSWWVAFLKVLTRGGTWFLCWKLRIGALLSFDLFIFLSFEEMSALVTWDANHPLSFHIQRLASSPTRCSVLIKFTPLLHRLLHPPSVPSFLVAASLHWCNVRSSHAQKSYATSSSIKQHTHTCFQWNERQARKRTGFLPGIGWRDQTTCSLWDRGATLFCFISAAGLPIYPRWRRKESTVGHCALEFSRGCRRKRGLLGLVAGGLANRMMQEGCWWRGGGINCSGDRKRGNTAEGCRV